MDERAEMLRAFKRGAVWTVEGRVLRRGEWLKASFVVSAVDVEHMKRADFEAFAKRQLPHVTEDIQYSPRGAVLV